jgi:PKD repeat protein
MSTNGGSSWTTNTDKLNHVIGCTDLAIDPTNPDIMYLATGDGNAADNYSIGLLKSTDGGQTWNTTGLSFSMGNTRMMSKILMHPNNSNILLVATSAGIYRSTDAAATWTLTQTGSFKDMEFKPGDPNTVYACGTEFFRSLNNGQSWTKITTGLPPAVNVGRMAIAVSPADPNYVFMIVGQPYPNFTAEGFYRSTNSGTSWTKISTPNIGAQLWYNLCIAVSPTNIQEIVVGGQTPFVRSTNGGTSWSNNGGSTHVDYHDVVYVSSTSYYMGNDGGIYRTTNSGSSWTNLNNNLAIAQMYGFGQSTTTPYLLITGWQDNGTNRYNGTTWSISMGGDGMLCFISKANDQNMWASYYNGALNRSTNGGVTFTSATSGINEAGAWVTPWREDPIVPNHLWAGFVNVWKSTNGGQSWTKPGNLPGNTVSLVAIAVSPANNQIIWASNGGTLYKSTNGGVNWSVVSSAPAGYKSYIACHGSDPNKTWITFSGFNAATKVFVTTDQGATWSDVSSPSLPNVPVNCIVHDHSSTNDAIYVGTDVGVFYKDNSLSNWEPFTNNLPNVVVTQLEIFYAGNKIRASTYGRGMWESDLYQPGLYAPTASFIADQKIGCPGAGIQFTDYSSGSPTAWLWDFPGGDPSTSTQQHPFVVYNTPGIFPVTLTVSNAAGSDTKTYNSYITIASSNTAPPVTTGATFCAPGQVTLHATQNGNGVLRWWDSPGGGNIVATGNSYSPVLTGTTTFYVDEDFPAGGLSDFVGAPDNQFGTGAFFTANDIRGLYFDVLQPVTLNTVEVYSNSAANRTIEVLDASGNLVVDTTVFIPASPNIPYVVTLNFKLYPGTGYFIKCRGYVDLYRNSSGANFPYTSQSINITGTNAGSGGYYYFFYNWIFTNFECNTARTPVTALDTCALNTEVLNVASGNLSIVPNPNEGLFTISFDGRPDEIYTLQVLNSLGQIILNEKLTGTGRISKLIDIRQSGRGVYMVSLNDSSRGTYRKVLTY